MVGSNTAGAPAPKHSVLDSSFPVLLPHDGLLFQHEDEFLSNIQQAISDTRCDPRTENLEQQPPEVEPESNESGRLKGQASGELSVQPPSKAPFVAGLEEFKGPISTVEVIAEENKTLTEKGDVTHISSNNPLVDLFHGLGERTQPEKLKSLLERAWDEDALMTLKIIFNARSIHLGKSDKIAFYKAFGWLAETHPITLLKNLSWLVRPVIEKKPSTTTTGDAEGSNTNAKRFPDTARQDGKDQDDDFEMLDTPVANPGDATNAHDVRFGVSHGYWKDLLNLVVFAANDELQVNGHPEKLLCQRQDQSQAAKMARVWDPQQAKALRKKKTLDQNQRVAEKLQKDDFYRGLHYTVARLFAQQLKKDAKLLKSSEKSDMKSLSLAAKWSPSFSEFHDKHTFILSSIAEILYPNASEICPDASNRELYLRHARELFRKEYASPLRKALAVVERDIASENFSDIKYDRVPSLAMNRYTSLFLKKDFDHFSEYINDVAQGKSKISGAILLPSTMVRKARSALSISSSKDLITSRILDGQWKTLVQRIKDSGALSSAIAIADVSGSMDSLEFKDGTRPMDASIGLSLLVAETTAPPFGGGFITFSEDPIFVTVGGPTDKRSFAEKVDVVLNSQWHMTTDFVAVFERLILPMALKNNLTQEDMVKQVFVFSDMQFDEARVGSDPWTSSYERIKDIYSFHGYEMPRLIFWNLAGDSTDKPVTNDDANTALVSGYSQGMLKVFLDGGDFEPEGEIEVVEETVADEEEMREVKVENKIDPMTLVKKAVSHKAYKMLEVVD